LEAQVRPYGVEKSQGLVIATTDPKVLPEQKGKRFLPGQVARPHIANPAAEEVNGNWYVVDWS
jgi:hypothetical protein